MTPQAISNHLFLTEISYDYGLITRLQYLLRQQTLLELADLNNGPGEKFPEYNINDESNFRWNIDDNAENLDEILEVSIGYKQGTEPVIMEFIVRTQGRYTGWKFHQNDRDDRPSIPHGHSIEDQVSTYKLDVYRGFIYDSNLGYDRAVSRETNKYIKMIWNLESFRQFAMNAIQFYVTSVDPNYDWMLKRNISQHFRLPRR